MDYNNDNGNGEHRGWQRDEHYLQKHFNGDISQCLWDEVTPNGEYLSYMLDETTPVKAYGDLAYHVDHDANMNKEHEEWRRTCLQLKKCRLQFDTQLEDSPFCDKEITPIFLKSNETKESLEEVFPQASQWDSGYQDISASSYNGLDQSSERWIADCFNDSEMHFSPNDMNLPRAFDIQIDISGMKSFIQTPTKLAIYVAYPFAFIKPCGVHGDVTLNEINQRIRTPPSKAKLRDEEPVVYPMSAFSGKPVVGKTKIRTEGGKGSITIMRTKG
ncbi:hypothetical protein POPTR_014G190000v4 [Populus trichocarpa]|uniref:Uncharacterized protein n=1 Tax=Populus trichocarpa TaxID=3694 RepID=A0ACC0S0F0_POPTR|nr:hypothetical protein POPTR_014G190000v4 [Populus trichocarpa]